MSKKQQVAQALQTAMQFHRAGQIEQAVGAYRYLLTLDARNSDACHLLGLSLHQLGRDDEAIPLFNRAIMLEPGNAACHANFAELWRKQNKLENAVDCYRKSLGLDPKDASIRQLLGEALSKLNRHEESIAEFKKLIDAGQATADTWWGMSEVLRQVDRINEAVAASYKATELNPNSDGAWHSLGWNLVRQGNVREALPHFNRAIQLAPDKPLLFWRRAWALLLLGEYENAWGDYESRWHDHDLQLKDRRPFPGPLWRGEDIAGKRVFIHLEQGLGDAIQFVRYVPLVKARGAHIILECPPSLRALVQRTMPEIELLNDAGPMPTPTNYDYHVPLLSLPYAFKTTVATIPLQIPYLKTDPAMVEAWGKRLAEIPGLKVGLVWSGSPGHKNDRHRSIRLDRLAPLSQVPGVRFVSLQKGPGAEQAATVASLNLIDWTADLNTFDDTAALIGALDLVIVVDTSVAHLAGATGRPVWTLLPFAPDFRWIIDRDDTPWYPTMRLFRQPAIRDWEGAIKKVAEALAEWSAR